MPEHSGLDLLQEWQKSMRSLASSVAGRAEIPAQILAPMHRQAELVQEII